MTQQTINSNLDKMLEDPKSRGFLDHLIHAYFPLSNAQKVPVKPRGVAFKCVLTKEDLMSTDDILEAIHSDSFKADFMDFLKIMFNPKADKNTPIANLMGEKKLAITGKNTTTFMAYSTLPLFYNWVLTKSLMGDKHISWLLKNITKGRFTENPFASKEDKGTVEGKAATFTLGETSFFKTLKEKFAD